MAGTEGRASTASTPGAADTGPALRIESGDPTPEELAALVVLLSALGGDGSHDDTARRRSAWSDPAWRLVGPSTRIGGWRASALPR